MKRARQVSLSEKPGLPSKRHLAIEKAPGVGCEAPAYSGDFPSLSDDCAIAITLLLFPTPSFSVGCMPAWDYDQD